jgi:FixJ family two-component response regulator
VIETRNAGEALLHCEKHPGTVDLLLTDVVMPHVSGTELADRLTGLEPGLSVLYMSGYTDGPLVRRAAVDRDIAFLQKPITAASLTRKVREVLDARDEARARARGPERSARPS